MAFDTDEAPRPRPVHEVGQDLAALSLHELDARIALLREEIARLEAARRRKEDSTRAANAVFR